MIHQYTSNYLLDATVLALLAGVTYVFLIRPRLKGRRTYNWIVRRVAKAVQPKATVGKSGPILRRAITASWAAVIGQGAESSQAHLMIIVSPAAPYHVTLVLAQNEEFHPLAEFELKFVNLKRLGHYPHLRALKRELTRAARLLLRHEARQAFAGAKEMAEGVEWGFIALSLNDIVSD